MTLALLLERNDRATLVSSDGRQVRLTSTRPFPPGSTLRGAAEGQPAPYVIKIKGCRRRTLTEETLYDLDGRFVNLTRGQREALERAGCIEAG